MSLTRSATVRPVPTTGRLGPTARGMLWMAGSGVIFCWLNALTRVVADQIGPFEAQFLRYIAGVAVMVPFILRVGLRAYHPHGLIGQGWRGVVHTTGLLLWYAALPRIPLADMTAIGFTTPIFIMIGAVVFFGERMVWARWVSALIGLLGVLVVVGPKMSGSGGFSNLLMLASSPLFACSFLITKALTRRDRPEVIVVWQAIAIATFTFPFAMLDWIWPSPAQYGWILLCGLMGSGGQYCVTRAIGVADVSATQPVKFLDLIWTSLIGYAAFAERPGLATMIGGSVIFLATTWITRREVRAGF